MQNYKEQDPYCAGETHKVTKNLFHNSHEVLNMNTTLEYLVYGSHQYVWKSAAALCGMSKNVCLIAATI